MQPSRTVTRVFLLFALTCGIAARAADWDHVHLSAPDTKAAAEWYAKHFGGEVTKSGPFDATLFGEALVKFKAGKPGFGGSQGTSVDHIGFSMPGLEEKMKALEADGAKVLGQVREVPAGGFSFAFVEDPWGTKIELIDDAELRGFHHVHIRVQERDTVLKWFTETFGGEVAPFKNMAALPGIKYDGMWLLAMESREPVEPIVDRAIEHLGWRMKDIRELAAKLEGQGTKFLVPLRESEGHLMAFIEGPQGIKIELVEDTAH